MENEVDLTQSFGKLVHDYNARERQLIENMRLSNISCRSSIEKKRGLPL